MSGRAQRWALLALAFAAVAARAQSGTSGEPGATPAPAPLPAPAPAPAPTPGPTPAPTRAPAPAAAAAPAPSPATPGSSQLAPVQITGSRLDDVQERRQSTAAKIVIGRDEIDRFGDSTLGDVLKRLPGVTVQGPPGRGGAIRFRGLGGGYTQILLDGQRVPPGFSLDSLTPDQIERIEILRAPTAETGARAIAGTINIVTRDGYNKRVNDLRLNAGYENGRFRPSASWSRNIAEGAWTVNYSLSAYHWGRNGSNTTTTVDERLSDDAVTLRQRDVGKVWTVGDGINGNGRLQWRSDGGIDTVTLMPIAYYNRGRWHRDGTLEQTVGSVPPLYDTAHSEGDYSSSLLRLNGQWNHRFDSTARLEWKIGVGLSRQPSDSNRDEYTSGGLTRTQLDSGSSRETSATSSLKFTHTVLDDHNIVGGLEVEALRESDDRTTLQNGLPILTDFGDDVRASSVRLAAYAQDEWSLTPNWAAHAGLRVEQITTRGTVAEGEPDAKNRSSVWTPLLHAVWKPDPKGRDQVRMSLTRSYRSPPLGNLIGRPSVNSRYPVPGPNTPTTPDRAGNPDLKPELATGIDVAVERYLPGSGLISANVFRRNIRDYLRSVTTLETVPYATSQRYVLRPQNVGRAMTEGIELELKFRASDLWPEAPRLDVRTNASFFRSKVKSVPGPDDRLDSQPDYTANLGLDYRFRAIPLTLGGNLNWTPGYLTRISDAQTATISRKLVADAYALYTFSPSTALRFTLSNLAAQDYLTGSSVDGPDFTGVPVRETASTRTPTYLNAQLRLELKL